jgi:hypothetical protein
MGTPGIEHVLCRRCYGVVDAVDNFCRRCGTPLNIGQFSPTSPPTSGMLRAELACEPSKSPGTAKWSQNPWVVLFVLFFVLGPLGLPMLWRSRFSLLWKFVLTVLMTALSVFIVAMIWHTTDQALAPLRELQKMKL